MTSNKEFEDVIINVMWKMHKRWWQMHPETLRLPILSHFRFLKIRTGHTYICSKMKYIFLPINSFPTIFGEKFTVS